MARSRPPPGPSYRFPVTPGMPVTYGPGVGPVSIGGLIARSNIPVEPSITNNYRYHAAVCVRNPSTGETIWRTAEIDTRVQIRPGQIADFAYELFAAVRSSRLGSDPG